MKTSQIVYLPFKRIISFLGATVGILLCFVFLWWWVIPVNAIVTKGHPFFIGNRGGKNGKPFPLIKFRSMRIDANPFMSSKDKGALEKVTCFGRFLRITSIDETPQLINILVGQMAFIGPRPLIESNINDGTTVQKRKENGSISLKPGLSGWAQIHNRSELDPSEKAEYDYYYLLHFSFFLDCKIFIFTILSLFGAVKGR